MRVVGSGRGAVPTSRPARLLGPPAEPDVRVPPHPALHKLMSSGYAIAPVAHGVALLICPR